MTVKDIQERGYSEPDVLVDTQWVADRLDDPKVRIVESNEDPLVYRSGHVPGAVEVDWTRDLNHPVRRDYLGDEGFAALAGRIGITPESTVIFYGDRNNWWAAYAFWVFRLFGHPDVRLMDGGRLKWQKEGRPLVREVPEIEPTEYPVRARDDSTIRAFRQEVLGHVGDGLPLIDVRSPEEFRGERLHMPDYPNEGAVRGGHIPGARSVPWARAVDPETGTFLDAPALRRIYEEEQGLSEDDDVIVYCRIGERSSHTWFVLSRLLGYPSVRNYDGSWTEWGNMVDVPIER